MIMHDHVRFTILALGMALAVAGCGGPEERKASYMSKAQAHIQEDNFPKARVALRNVLKIDPKDAEAYYLFAEVEEKEKNWKEAFGNYLKVVELVPDHERALLKLAKFYLQGGAIDQVLDTAEKVLAKTPGQVEAHTLKIAVQAVRGDRNGALGAAEALAQQHPTDPDAATLLATLYLAGGRTADVEPVLQRAVEANPGNLQLKDSFASALMRLQQYERAEEVLKQMIETEPKNLDRRIRLAGFYDEQRQFDKAEATLREVIRLDAENEQRYLALAKFQYARKGASEGEAALMEAQKALPKSPAIRFARGELYELNRQPDKARAAYEAARNDFRGKPAELEAKVKLAALDLSAGKREEAEQQLAEVLKENPRASDALLLRGKISLQQGKAKDAIQDFRSVLKDQPELADVHALLGRAYMVTNDKALAKESLEKAVALNPRLSEAQMALAALDSSSGHLKDARTRVEGLSKQDPKNLKTLSVLLRLQAAEKDWAATAETLARAREAGADSAMADLAEGRLHQARKEWPQAKTAFERAAARYPDSPEPLIALVQLDLQQRKPANARKRLDEVLARNPNHPYAAGLLGEIALMEGDRTGAESRFREATRRKPDWAQPWQHLAGLKLAQKQSDEAREILESGLKANPKSEELRMLLATSLTEAGQVDRAIDEYETLLRHNPRLLIAANNLASLLADQKGDQKSLERALALSQDFETTAPNAFFLDTLGWVHHKLGNSGQAVHFIQQALAKAPDHPVVNYHLGLAYYKVGQTAEAKTYLQKAVASPKPFPGLDEAKSVLAQLQG
jgi:tetratricopeptide (TPR) repeat protein